jgi:hypothetical protein
MCFGRFCGICHSRVDEVIESTVPLCLLRVSSEHLSLCARCLLLRKADMRAFRHHKTLRSATYFRSKGTNRTGAAVLVVAVPSACFANTMSC